MTKMRLIFMGTPTFAVPSLEAILATGHTVEAVVTQPDRPSGRGQRPATPPVKTRAVAAGLTVWQPAKVREPAFLETVRGAAPDLIAVVAFGQILPAALLRIPRLGCVNLHASLLPKYRGAAPIQWALIRGERETGATTILMDEGMDTGRILLQEPVPIREDDTAESLSARLAEVGARLLVETITGLEKGRLTRRSQDHARATLAPRLKKDDGLIPWDRPATEIVNFVRGTTPWPGATTFYEARRWRLWQVGAAEAAGAGAPVAAPGQLVRVGPDALIVQTGQDRVRITELQPEGGRRMTAQAFLQGHRVAEGVVLKSHPRRIEP